MSALASFWSDPLDGVGTATMIRDIVRRLCVGPPPLRAVDERIARALAIIRQMEAPSADSAHLTRTFYQMFGISPTAMVGAAEFWEIPAPFELEAG